MKSKEKDVSIVFKQGNTDDRILKSLVSDEEHQYDIEELSKAINRAGLVQKEVQVKGKNGQTFTRKQWVKSNESQSSVDNPKAQEENNKIPHKVTGKNMSELVSNLKQQGFSMDSADQSSPQDTVTLYQGKKEFTATFNKYSDGGVEVINLKSRSNDSDTESSKNPSDKNENAKKMPQENSETSKQHWTKAGTSQEAKAQIAQMLASGKSREDCMAEFKSQGVTWKESDHAGINWMRAAMAMNKHLTSGNVTNNSQSEKKEKNVDTSKEVISVRDSLENSGTATTSNKEIADMYKNSKNSSQKFDVKDNKDGSYTITSDSKEKKSVVGSDYTQLTTEEESGTIEGEAHNIMVGKLGTEGKRKPTEREVKSVASSLKDEAIKKVISSYNQDELVHQLAMAKQFTKLAGGNMGHMTLERIYRDSLSSGSNCTQEQKCNAMAKLLGSDYISTSSDTVARYSNNTDAAVHIRPLSRGNFEATFTYGDGVGSTKETYDSIDSVKKAADKWIAKEDDYFSKKK